MERQPSGRLFRTAISARFKPDNHLPQIDGGETSSMYLTHMAWCPLDAFTVFRALKGLTQPQLRRALTNEKKFLEFWQPLVDNVVETTRTSAEDRLLPRSDALEDLQQAALAAEGKDTEGGEDPNFGEEEDILPSRQGGPATRTRRRTRQQQRQPGRRQQPELPPQRFRWVVSRTYERLDPIVLDRSSPAEAFTKAQVILRTRHAWAMLSELFRVLQAIVTNSASSSRRATTRYILQTMSSLAKDALQQPKYLTNDVLQRIWDLHAQEDGWAYQAFDEALQTMYNRQAPRRPRAILHGGGGGNEDITEETDPGQAGGWQTGRHEPCSETRKITIKDIQDMI